ncbi:MAG TPA: DUF882 domain-containing protein [Dongiaceae bacterium]|nr:DUF882 domain-containing protein [Dongiaceae bacterium]
MTRRRLLGLGLGAASMTLLPRFAEAAMPTAGSRALHLCNEHTGEAVNATYWENGRYDAVALKDINFILRDHHNDEVTTIDVQLLDLLSTLHRRSGSKQAFQVVCGYRSPQTNAILVSESRGVASNSLHVVGKAIDIRLADRTPRQIRDCAKSLRLGGVGYYPRAAFVHVDTGSVRYW